MTWCIWCCLINLITNFNNMKKILIRAKLFNKFRSLVLEWKRTWIYEIDKIIWRFDCAGVDRSTTLQTLLFKYNAFNTYLDEELKGLSYLNDMESYINKYL